jgi:FixJ family two-component response regulator
MIQGFLQETTLSCRTFSSGREFLTAYQQGQPGCLVLETVIPDMGGLQIHRRLAADKSLLPVIFVASRMDVSTAVELMRQGVVHVLEKPVRPVDLHGAIHEAIALDAERRRQHSDQQKARLRVASLTRKERQVLQLIGAGKSVKVMAAELRICVRAIELRRRSLMAKLALDSPVELMRFSVDVSPLLAEHAEHDGWRTSLPASVSPRSSVPALGKPGYFPVMAGTGDSAVMATQKGAAGVASEL